MIPNNYATVSSITDALQADQSLQEIMGFSEEMMKQFYKVAYDLFQNGREKEAADAFFFLVTINPKVYLYWLALGMCEQSLSNYDRALSAYAMASLLDVENPLPYYHSAACYYALQDEWNMKISLKMALEYFTTIPEHVSLKVTSQKILDLLSN